MTRRYSMDARRLDDLQIGDKHDRHGGKVYSDITHEAALPDSANRIAEDREVQIMVVQRWNRCPRGAINGIPSLKDVSAGSEESWIRTDMEDETAFHSAPLEHGR